LLPAVSRAFRSLSFRSLTGEAWTFEPAGAAVRVPAVVTALAVGFAVGRPLQGVVAASGAFLVGFGAGLELFGSHMLPLAGVTLVIGASATLCSVAAAHGMAAVVVVAALGALCGFAASRGPAAAWIGVQAALAGVVATSYPASLAHAGERALLIVAGGLAQTLVLSLAHMALRRVVGPAPPPAPERRYALHLAAGLALALSAEQALSIRNGYWVPMTTLLVLRPTTQSTMARALARTLGTLAGVASASALLLSTRPPRVALACLVGAAAFGAYTFQKATYGLFSAFVAMYVVFLLALAGLPEEQVAVARIVATLVGACVGLAVQIADSALGRARLVPLASGERSP